MYCYYSKNIAHIYTGVLALVSWISRKIRVYLKKWELISMLGQNSRDEKTELSNFKKIPPCIQKLNKLMLSCFHTQYYVYIRMLILYDTN